MPDNRLTRSMILALAADAARSGDGPACLAPVAGPADAAALAAGQGCGVDPQREHPMTTPEWFRRPAGSRPLAATLAVVGAAILSARAAPALAEPERPAPAAVGAASERLAVEQVLASMERAVLAGDAEAYLRHVVPAAGEHADPVYRKEQENWARDLAGHTPAEFGLAIVESDDSPARFWPARAEFRMKMRWRMKAEDTRAGGDRVRAVTIPVVFVRSDEADAWLFAGENWIVVEGPPEARVRVKCAEGYERAARDAAEVFPEVRAHVEEGFEQAVDHVQEVKIYRSEAHLQASIYLSYVDSLGGWNEPGESIKLLGMAASSRASLRQVLAHEFGHVATFEYGPHATDMPWWILEGVAEMSAQRFSRRQWDNTVRTVLRWADRGTLQDWKDLADFRSVPAAKHSYVYRQGEHMIGYISDRFGRSGRNAWLRAMARGRSLDDATRETLGLPFAQLDADWRRSLDDLLAPDRPDAPEPAATQP